MPRGGVREGSGRKKISESGRKNLALSLQQNQIDYIKKLAKKANKTNSQLVYDAIKYYEENYLNK